MPFTLFAHQVPVLPIKRRWPHRVDGTALCVGSMAPDLTYAVSSYVHTDTHLLQGVPLVWAIAIVLTLVVRFVLMDVVPPHLPDAGQFRLKSWRAVARRSVSPIVTALSALAGIATHLVLDAFTHPGRLGVRLLGYADVTISIGSHREPLAGVFQVVGHSLGSTIGVWMMYRIGRDRLIERWVGDAAVARARAVEPRRDGTMLFLALLVAGEIAGAAWGWNVWYVARVQRLILGATAGVLLASLMPRCRASLAAVAVGDR